jgi:integrase
VKKHILTFNPCTTVDYPKGNKKELEFYTVEEVKKMLELFQNERSENKPYVVFFTLAVYMGARRGELTGLEWKDVDFDNAVISINRAYYIDKGGCYTDTPKTATSRRSLKLPVHIMNVLKDYREWQNVQRETCGGSWVECDRLFTSWDGTPMNLATPYNYFMAFCERTGMRKVSIHSFRHFNASVLIHSGVDVVKVQTSLGHSTPTTTLNQYSHAFNTARTRAMEAVANAIEF